MSAPGSGAAEAEKEAPSSLALLGNALGLLENAQRQMRASVAGDLDLSLSELTALTAVAEYPGCTPKMLGLEISFTTGAVTALIDRLARAGLLDRRPNPNDRRSVLLELTASGAGMLDDVRRRYADAVADVLHSSPHLADDDVVEDLARAAAVITSHTIA